MRCCSVTPCSVVAVLLVTFGGAACNGKEATSPACYYKEHGVTNSCAVFQKVACETLNSTTVVPFQPYIMGEDYGSIDGQRYCNVTSELWHSEGYFGVKQTGECWQFQTGGSRYPESPVPVTLDYFPDPNGTDIVVYRDGEQCAYLYSITFTLQLYREDNGTLKVRFTLQPVPGIQQVELTLMGGKCNITCNGNENDCDLSFNDRIMNNFSAHEDFPSLAQGYYCMRVKHGACIVHTPTYTLKRTELLQPDSPNDNSVFVVVSWTIPAVALVVILLVLLKRRRYGTLRQLLNTDEQDPPAQWQNIHQQWASSPDACQILLLYSRDCRQLCDVVQALSQLLKSFGNMKVLDPLEQNQMEEVSENISGWLAQHLRNPDVKVVIVVSEGAKLRQRALLNNQIVHIAYPHFLDPVYTQALQQMHEDPNLGSDYKRIFPVRFEELTPNEESLALIVPLKCYILQKHLGKLIVELRAFNTPTGPDLEDIRSICPKEVENLESTIRTMKSYCDLNPHYIGKHFPLVVPST